VFSELAAAYKGKVVFAKVDGDRNKPILTQFGVNAFPTFLFLHKGKEYDRIQGADEGRLRATITSFVERAENAPSPYKHFPLKPDEPATYTEIKYDKVVPPLVEKNKEMGCGLQLDEREVQAVHALVAALQSKAVQELFEEQLQALAKLLAWPVGALVSPLNLLRMVALHPSGANALAQRCAEGKERDLVGRALDAAKAADKPVIVRLAAMTVANCFDRYKLRRAMADRNESVLEIFTSAMLKFEDGECRLACLSVFANFAVLFRESKDAYEAGRMQILTAMSELLRLEKRPRVLYRALMVLGTIAYRDDGIKSFAVDIGVPQLVQQLLTALSSDDSGDGKAAKEAAQELLQELKPRAS